MKSLVLLLVVMIGIAAAQDAPKPLTLPKASGTVVTLTPDEIRELREVEVDLLQAKETQHQAEESAAKAHESLQAAADKFNAKVAAIYSARKITPQDVAICDGPFGGEICANGKPHDLRLVALPAKLAAKDEAKK